MMMIGFSMYPMLTLEEKLSNETNHSK